MAQDGTTAGGSSYTIDNVTFPVGRSKLQSIFDAIRSTNIGNTAPDLVAGQFWIDNNTPSTTVWTLYLYDGTDNISFATIDTVNNTVNFLDSTFTQLTSDLASNGNNINFGDNDKAQFGASNDLQIYHSGTNSIIDDLGTGNLLIRSDGSAISLQVNSKNNIRAVSDAEVELYYNNNLKFETTSTGVDVTGTVVSDGLTVAGNVSVDGGTIKLDGNYPVGSNNVALGNGALDDGSLSGNNNTAIGDDALSSNTSGGINTAIGGQSLRLNSTGDCNVGVGYASLFDNTTGLQNTSVGSYSLANNTTASNNTAVGFCSLYANTTGNSHTAIGQNSLQANTTGNYNTAVGRTSLFTNTTGGVNVAIGWESMYGGASGDYNTAVGAQTLCNNIASYNTAIGRRALRSNTTGSSNTGIGQESLLSNTTASNNTAPQSRWVVCQPQQTSL